MKKRLILVIAIIGAIILVLFIHGMMHAFDPEYSKVEIKQKIGGVLICNTVYNADQHSWQYDVKYSYKDKNGKIFEIGNGIYSGREWVKNEQLVPFKKWFILKTGGWIGTDKVIIGDSKFQKFTEYEFTPDSIERDSIWLKAKIHSLIDYDPSEVFINNISNGHIELTYKFRINETNTALIGVRKIIYDIDPQTGKLVMKRIF